MEEQKTATPESKDRDVDETIRQHMGFAMAAGAIPFPIVDIAAVTAVQLDMLAKICRIHGIDYSEERGKTLMSSLLAASVGSWVGKAGASALKAIPGIGTVLGIGSQAVVAGATTYAIGRVFHTHFRKGGTLFNFDVSAMKDAFTERFQEGKEQAQKKDATPGKDEAIETIARLHSLLESGAITEEEYAKAKASLLEGL